VRLLDGLNSHGIISQRTADTLKTAYCTYRNMGHKQVLRGDKVLIDEDEVTELRTQIEQIWQTIMV
jgi:glutamate-ammonia-ligase adenylyltransferase